MDAIAEQLIEAALARLKSHSDASARRGEEDERRSSLLRDPAAAAKHFPGAESQMRFAIGIINTRIDASGCRLEMVSSGPLQGGIGTIEVRLSGHSGDECRLSLSVDEIGNTECRMADRRDSRKMRAFNILDVDQAHYEQLLATFFSKAVSETGRML